MKVFNSLVDYEVCPLKETVLIKYFKDVLGLQSVVLDKESLKSIQPLNKVTEKNQPLTLFILGKEGFGSKGAKDLFQKMIEAMRLDDNEWKVLNEYEGNLSKTYVFFCKKEYKKACLKKWSVLTYSPNALLLHPEYKKQTWTELKKVMVWLGKL